MSGADEKLILMRILSLLTSKTYSKK